MLKKLTKRGNDDISDLKIYWDTEKKQLRHKFYCDDCGTPTICLCYEKLYEAVEGIETGMLCNKCALFTHLNDGDCDLETLLKFITAEQEIKISGKVIEFLTEEQMGKILRAIEGEMDLDCVGSACNV